MPIIRLAELAPALTNLTCDVCIVGAGAAGIYLGTRLGEYGIRTILVEAGPKTSISAAQVGFIPIYRSERYGGVIEGRMFGLGGTTSRWGGQLFPYTTLDQREPGHPYAESWKRITTDVEKQLATVLGVLGIPTSLFASDGVGDDLEPLNSALMSVGLSLAASVWLPFRQRNFRHLLAKKATDSVTVLLEAVACNWATVGTQDKAAFVNDLQVIGPNGRRLEIHARQFVIAAGAIESARILLELNSRYNNNLLPSDAAVGCYLSDHLSASVAAVRREDIETAALLFSPCFEHNFMRTVRILAPGTQYMRFPRFFAHFVFDRTDMAFDTAKAALLALQMHKMPAITPKQIMHSLPGLWRFMWQRLVKRKLYVPLDTKVYLHIDFEQAPMRRNSVYLDTECDGYGRHRVILDWKISDEDYLNASELSRMLLSHWAGAALNPLLPQFVISDSGVQSSKLYDTYHPVGTCMLGVHKEAVVSPKLAVRGTANLSVLSTGIFPSAGTANPTLSMLCYGELLAQHLRPLFK